MLQLLAIKVIVVVIITVLSIAIKLLPISDCNWQKLIKNRRRRELIWFISDTLFNCIHFVLASVSFLVSSINAILCRLEPSLLLRNNGSASGSLAIDKDRMYCLRKSFSSSISSMISLVSSQLVDWIEALRLDSLSIRQLADWMNLVGSVFGFKEQRLNWFLLWNTS